MEIKFSEYSESLFYDSESRDLDGKTIETFGISGSHLMGFAALSIYRSYRKKILSYDRIQILCGSGNNGGDGLALAFFLAQEGKLPEVYLKTGRQSADSEYYKNLFLKAGGEISPLETYSSDVRKGTVFLVDALLGTGFRPPLEEDYSKAANEINSLCSLHGKNVFVLSLDTITGFAEKSSPPIPANALAEIGTRKWRNVFVPGTVKTSFHRIGFPIGGSTAAIIGKPADKFLWKRIPRRILQHTTIRKRDSHKYENGSLLLVGGSEGMSGAAVSSLLAFHSLGGGISQLLTPSENTVVQVLKKDPSLMVGPIPPNTDLLSLPFPRKVSTVLLGPGLKTEECPILNLSPDKHTILDAGAIPAYKEIRLNDRTLFTPHTGELEILVNSKITSVENGLSLCKEYVRTFGGNILWKRHSSFLICSDEKIYVWNRPEPKLAVMGTGDLLAGILAFYLSRKFTVPQAVQLSYSLLNEAAGKTKDFPTASSIRKIWTRKGG
ncbi:bifunctional ADP-dependent NAD(P)H-hydrate dehydratase/NAD(P)H-hydrate epimerase [Leptospira gomenensis]|uniref:Bifunctional NAD(P)H-hydrate repair enzyme n=1 Tax=Leptospira gomenensis TaxID=2484974 RepID=A0A5F1Z0J1_9LEPT|nr:bifunctional ADP-dependent NAD(P)H-hydrate dehydratase/NAD(P)H-hydrate epimerase [Leptospira gomenensis]TGK31066.1 bifunctional ADP-dependent NAD(P)H-hydrate dehydratase/NAD(P)H-hydrate epimerase [Leptospira gomenensis]TGK43270.1 bifunctional ADP-dependent NAD(P)H-hydrate dehydratase/NAD(P)H-hydrate epimerase [Leptospira gomenensis]TGK45215.1 bifunctional ADP-dependent NAD(P)H-hydrate dehydratase/NAD(P)H-hydrate epimerase [Leptospira gomenensis]TGK66129.1 bifunctional ADP-dependent NAD(P)H-h